jgi:hypothetical protein
VSGSLPATPERIWLAYTHSAPSALRLTATPPADTIGWYRDDVTGSWRVAYNVGTPDTSVVASSYTEAVDIEAVIVLVHSGASIEARWYWDGELVHTQDISAFNRANTGNVTVETNGARVLATKFGAEWR